MVHIMYKAVCEFVSVACVPRLAWTGHSKIDKSLNDTKSNPSNERENCQQINRL